MAPFRSTTHGNGGSALTTWLAYLLAQIVRPLSRWRGGWGLEAGPIGSVRGASLSIQAQLRYRRIFPPFVPDFTRATFCVNK